MPINKKLLAGLCLLLSLTFVPATFCNEPVWCAKPVGAAIRDEVRRQDASAIAFAKSFVDFGGTYVYLKKVEQSVELAAERARWRAKWAATGHTESVPDQDLNRILNKAKSDAVLNGEIKPTTYWFFDTNSEAIKSAFRNKIQFDIAKGGVLEMTPDIESRFLTDYTGEGGGGLIDIVSRIEAPDFILIETGDSLPRNLSVRNGAGGPLIMQVRPGVDANSLGGKANLFQKIIRSDPKKTLVLNLLPTKPGDAQDWGFEHHKSEEYAANGKRISEDLLRYGFSVTGFSTKEALIATITGAGEMITNIILIGEAGPDGTGVRIPTSSQTLTDLDLKPIQDRVTLTGLICNSNQTITSPNSASIAGTLFTDETRKFLRMALDSRDPASAVEYIGVPAKSNHLADTISKSFDSLSASRVDVVLIAGKASGLTSIAASIASSASPTAASGAATPPQPSQPTNPDRGGSDPRDDVTGTLVISAIVGGLLRELLRWKKLTERKRGDLYLKPKFLAISLAEILLGVWVGLIFSKLVASTGFRVIVCFVAAAGVEELVRRAAKLRIWVPSVPQGPDPNLRAQASTLEFLRA